MLRGARKIREAKGFSLTDIVRSVDITYAHLSRFERGEAELSVQKLQELAHFYGVSMEALLEEVKEPVQQSV